LPNSAVTNDGHSGRAPEGGKLPRFLGPFAPSTSARPRGPDSIKADRKEMEKGMRRKRKKKGAGYGLKGKKNRFLRELHHAGKQRTPDEKTSPSAAVRQTSSLQRPGLYALAARPTSSLNVLTAPDHDWHACLKPG
jgi:hypothetical protein